MKDLIIAVLVSNETGHEDRDEREGLGRFRAIVQQGPDVRFAQDHLAAIR